MATATAEKIDDTQVEIPIKSNRPPPGKKALSASDLMKPPTARNDWFVRVNDIDPTYEDVLNGWYWRNVVGNLSVGDVIEVQHEHTKLWALLQVRAWDPLGSSVVVEELFRKDMAPLTAEQTIKEAFTIEYRGTKDRHVVIRTADGKVMQTGFAVKQDCLRYIDSLTPRTVR
jgi:hypothetical protein